MENSISDRVARGISCLNNYFGHSNWKQKINLDIFDTNNLSRCVIGQLFGDYFSGLAKLGELGQEQSENYGFIAQLESADAKHISAKYSELTSEWIKQLQNKNINEIEDIQKQIIATKTKLDELRVKLAELQGF